MIVISASVVKCRRNLFKETRIKHCSVRATTGGEIMNINSVKWMEFGVDQLIRTYDQKLPDPCIHSFVGER